MVSSVTPLMPSPIFVQRCGSSPSERVSSAEDHAELLGVRAGRVRHGAGGLVLGALVHQQRRVAAVVEDHVRPGCAVLALVGQRSTCSVHHQYSSSVSPFQA